MKHIRYSVHFIGKFDTAFFDIFQKLFLGNLVYPFLVGFCLLLYLIKIFLVNNYTVVFKFHYMCFHDYSSYFLF